MRTLLIALAAGALLHPTEELLSHYTVGELRRTVISFEEKLLLTEATMTVDGEEVPEAFDLEQEESSKGSVTFEDRISRLEDGELDAFERRYVELGEEYAIQAAGPAEESLDERSEMTCPLEGRRVLFFRDEAGECFIASFPDGEEGDAEWLEGITTELPWAELLPEGEVGEGDSWKIDPEIFDLVMRFAGDLPYECEGEEGAEIDASPEADFDTSAEDSEFTGEITATLEGFESIDGLRQARITLAVDYVVATDLTDLEEAGAEDLPDDQPPYVPEPEFVEVGMELALEGEGTLLWDLGAGRLASMDLALQLEETQHVVMLFEEEGGEERIEQTLVSEGTHRMEVRVEEGEK